MINKILKKNAHKVISVIGDFDKICLKDSSVDFCIAWESLHHSNNVFGVLIGQSLHSTIKQPTGIKF